MICLTVGALDHPVLWCGGCFGAVLVWWAATCERSRPAVARMIAALVVVWATHVGDAVWHIAVRAVSLEPLEQGYPTLRVFAAILVGSFAAPVWCGVAYLPMRLLHCWLRSWRRRRGWPGGLGTIPTDSTPSA